jgi:hypothetical protein
MVTDRAYQVSVFGSGGFGDELAEEESRVIVRLPKEWYEEDGSFKPEALKSGDRYVLVELSRGKFTLAPLVQ